MKDQVINELESLLRDIKELLAELEEAEALENLDFEKLELLTDIYIKVDKARDEILEAKDILYLGVDD